ncbi:Apoptosis antagonizing transcription factor/protein transport protein [Ceraceosorus bombacis]|uniref:Protein BFR2 n=1 Tax=Ceraceosorus bombacis TaxID=401625 RepID=A0A0P1BB61_9BASI|nr:Apoptosis antagonizing transcription factor/protein transport protein [Ceraceosorus bombacis]
MPSSLSNTLAQLSNPSPSNGSTGKRSAQLDPATSYHSASDDESDASDDEDIEDDGLDVGKSKRTDKSHYVDVGPSSRRRTQMDESGMLSGSKYAGRTVSASQAFDDASGSEDEGGDDAEEASGISGSASDEDLDSDESDEAVGAAIPEGSSAHKSAAIPPASSSAAPLRVRFAKDTQYKSSEADRGEGGNTLAAAAQADSELMSRLQAQTADDAQRGRAVKEQYRQWEAALRARIQFQSFLKESVALCRDVNALSQIQTDPECAASYKSLQSDLAQLNASIFSKRAAIAEASDSQVAAAFHQASSVLGKRPASGEAVRDGDIDQSISAFLSLHRVTAEKTCVVLDAWSTSGPSGSSRELKAVNRAAGEQVRSSLAQPESMKRLLKRTRVWRGADRLGEEGVAATSYEPDENVFDDTDFYSSLLRELLDSKGEGASGSDGLMGLTVRSKGPKRAVDTRASKGRRLKYEVHDKIANFMPPIPNETWTDEQRARLLAQLSVAHGTLSAQRGASSEGQKSSKEHTLDHVDLAGLRVFG